MESGNESEAEFARTLENIPSEEYEKALELIKAFNEKSLEEISSLDQLSEVTVGLGDALMKVAHAKGSLNKENKSYLFAPEIEDLGKDKLEKEIEENPRNVFSMTTSGDQFVTLSFMPYGELPINGSFQVTLPVAAINAESEDPGFLGQIGGFKHKDGEDFMYQPRISPDDIESLKAYASLIKQGVGEVLKTNPAPSEEIPRAFLQ